MESIGFVLIYSIIHMKQTHKTIEDTWCICCQETRTFALLLQDIHKCNITFHSHILNILDSTTWNYETFANWRRRAKHIALFKALTWVLTLLVVQHYQYIHLLWSVTLYIF